MKSIRSILHILLGVTLICSCNEATELAHITPNVSLIKYKDIVKIDSLYTYPGDSLYQNWINQYNKNLEDKTSRSLSPEDDAFFNKQYIVKSTEATVLYGRNYIFPGSILEGNSISNQNYIPVFISNRKPITVSMTLAHNTPKPTSRTIEAPTFSKLSDYVVEMVTDGNFEQNQKFMFSYKRFSFYDEPHSEQILIQENYFLQKVKVQQNTGIKYKSQQECMLNSSNQVSPSTWILLL